MLSSKAPLCRGQRSINHACQSRCRTLPPLRAAARQQLEVDVVVIGAGIIGLMTAQSLLRENLSVALVERKQLGAGATGAGQGYIWMSHRTPATPAWELAAHSTALWRSLTAAGPAHAAAIQWQGNGSLLVARTASESQALRERQALLLQHGVTAEFYSAAGTPDTTATGSSGSSGSSGGRGGGGGGGGGGHGGVNVLEPALRLPREGAALLVEGDAQINGRLAAAVLLSECRASPLFHVFLDEPMEHLELDHRIVGRCGLMVAAGVWSAQILADATAETGWAGMLQPRRGHLLELLQPPAGMPVIKHGIMEMAYTKHYSDAHARGSTRTPEAQSSSSSSSSSSSTTHTTSQPTSAPLLGLTSEIDITFTATTSATGSLLIGSSREFSGWESTPSLDIIYAIMDRASLFLPHLSEVPASALVGTTRVGLRPFATHGLPMIGPVPGCPGVFVAAGHEGSGLSLGPATSEIIKHYITSSIGHTDLGHSSQQPASSAVASLLNPDLLSALLPATHLHAARTPVR
ncbi:MAG: hypothetical protein WDW38_005848 [Sanguina aurantia]